MARHGRRQLFPGRRRARAQPAPGLRLLLAGHGWCGPVSPHTWGAPTLAGVAHAKWLCAAATYARMLHPEVFPGAVATSHPLTSSPEGNNQYRSFLGSVYELYAAGGSLSPERHVSFYTGVDCQWLS